MTASLPTLPRLVAIHGAPRSGTSWLGQLFNSSEHVAYRYQPLFSYTFRGSIDGGSNRTEIERFMAALLETDDDFVLQRGKASLAGYSLDFPKGDISHLVYKEVRHHEILANLLARCPRALGIGIVRNPCAVIHSWSRAPREFNSAWNLRNEWREAGSKNREHPGNWYGFVRWKQLTELFHSLESSSPDRFLIVRYEDLVVNPAEVVGRLFGACQLPLSRQVSEFVERSRATDDGSPYGVFRDASRDSDAWRLELDPGIVQEIKRDLAGTSLERYLESWK